MASASRPGPTVLTTRAPSWRIRRIAIALESLLRAFFEASGYGKFIHADGDIYEAQDLVLDLGAQGDWQDDKAHGHGRLSQSSQRLNLYGS